MSIFDETDALVRTGGDRELLGEILRFTFEDIPPLMAELEASLRKQRFEEAGDLAHKGKGSAGSVGAANLYMAFLALENMLNSSEFTDLQCRNCCRDINLAFEVFCKQPRVLELVSLDHRTDAPIG